MYKTITETMYGITKTFVIRDNGNDSFTSFFADPANTDYQEFKKYLATSGAELQDATGTAMTADQIKTFMGTLP